MKVAMLRQAIAHADADAEVFIVAPNGRDPLLDKMYALFSVERVSGEIRLATGELVGAEAKPTVNDTQERWHEGSGNRKEHKG